MSTDTLKHLRELLEQNTGGFREYFYRAHKTCCYEANPQLADDLAWAHIAALEGRQP